MSVAADMLLKIGPELKTRAAPDRHSAKAPEPVKREPSSFSQMYAKERQAKAIERSEGPGKPAQTKDEPEPLADEAVAESDAAAPTLAENGKDLPEKSAEDAAPEGLFDESAIDPLLLLGITMPAEESAELVTLPAVDEQVEPLLSADEGEGDAELEAELETIAQTPLTPEQLALSGMPQQAAVLPGQAGLVAQASKGGESAARELGKTVSVLGKAGEGKQDGAATAMSSEPELAELKLAGLALASLDTDGSASQEQSSDPRESFANKLSMLTQAVTQQQAIQRPVLIPGQPVAMQQGGWSEAVVDRVMWLSSQNLKSAEIQLNPAELGRLEVRISMHQDQAQVSFASPNAGVRDALEAQMHRLREMFAQQGMGMLDANVSDQSLARGWQGQGDDGKQRGSGSSSAEQDLADEGVQHGVTELRGGLVGGGRGLVDYYA